MKKKTPCIFTKTYYLIGFLVLVGLIVFIADNPAIRNKITSSQDKNDTPQYLIENFNPENVQKIEITKTAQKTTLEFKNNKWILSSEDNYKAIQSAVTELLNKVKNFKKSDLISNNKNKKDTFEVTKEKGLNVDLYDKTGKLYTSFIIGKTGQLWSSKYIRRSDSDEVYLIDDISLMNTFEKPVNGWKDKQILSFNQDKIKQLAVNFDHKKTAFEKRADGIWMTEPQNFLTEKTKTDELLSNIVNYQTQDFIAINNETLKTYSLEPGKEQGKIFILLDDGTSLILYLGTQKDDQNFYYGKMENGKFIYKISKSDIDKLKINPEDYKKKEVPKT